MSKAYQRYLDALEKRLGGDGDSPEVIKEMQLSFMEALEEHIAWMMTKDNLPPNKVEGHPMMAEMAHGLKYYIEEIISGHRSSYLEPLPKGKGKVGRHPNEMSCIGDAVRYRYYVEIGKIKDKRPTERIHEWFGKSEGLNIRTVKTWFSDPKFSHVKTYDRDKYPADAVKKYAEYAGGWYKKHYIRKL